MGRHLESFIYVNCVYSKYWCLHVQDAEWASVFDNCDYLQNADKCGGRGHRDEMVKAMDRRIIVREFEIQSFYYVHFRTNNLGKGIEPP